ncbi:YdgA family protein [Castellaniella sp.]|uniref:YdgA family protein n=1 Tax=Castellaniella sp. TaxID=1955812 RepID=UPI002AFF8908|nr:YdgA family protein [Castellaniella sp.]
MSRRLKIAAGAAAVLVLAYGAASWYAGRTAQQTIESWVAQANQEIKTQWASDEAPPTLRLDGYQRGIFSSQVRYVFEFRDEQGTAQALTLQDDLQHGPWPLAAVGNGHWQALAAYSRMQPLPDGLWQPWFDAMGDGAAAPWQADSLVGFDGGVASTVTLAPVRTPDQGLDFSGGEIQLTYQPQTRQLTVAAQAQSLLVRDTDLPATVRLEGLQYDNLTTRSGDVDLQSHQQLQLTQFQIVSEGAPDVRFKQPSMQVDTARTGSLMDSRIRYDLGQLQAGEQDMGAIQLEASIEQLDVPSFQAMVMALDRMQANQDDDASPLSAQDEQQLRALAIPLLASSPRLSLDTLSWTTPSGKTDLQAQVQFRPAPDDAPQDLGALLERGIAKVAVHAGVSKPMLLDVLRRSQAGGDADMMTALVSMLFDQYAGRLTRAELVREQDGRLQADMSYADGQVTVNDRSMTPAAFMQQLDAALGSGNF